MTDTNLIGFGQAQADCAPSCFKQVDGYNFGLGVIRSGAWIMQNPLVGGYSATESYLPPEKVGISVAVTFLPGATMMTRLDLLRDLHGFRDEFFMYVEDIDLCARVLRRGLTIAVVPRARVSHHLPERSVAPTLEFHKVKNLSALYLMHAPLRVLHLFVCRYGMLGAIRALASGRVGSHLRAWAWTFWNTPRLLTERRQFHASAAPPAAPVS